MENKVTSEQIERIIKNGTLEVQTLGDKTTLVKFTTKEGFVIVATSSCVSPEKKLIGTWKGDVEVLGVTANYEYVFNEDGTGKMTGSLGAGVAFTYNVAEDGTLSIVTTLLGVESTRTYTFAVEKNTLTLTENDTVITLTKAE